MKGIIYFILFLIIPVAGIQAQGNGTVDHTEVDQMPQFPGCENTSADAGKLSDCSYREMTTYVVKNVKYPETARKKGISGMPVIQFVVDQSGRVRDVEVIKSAEATLDAEAKRAVEQMMLGSFLWTPGKKDGKAVSVQLTIPIKFKV